jgi:membrane-associated phospholipid phosphatase
VDLALTKRYAFVDYATQGYCVLVGLLILIFHNDCVLHWRALVGAHVAGLLLIHGLIQWHGRVKPWPALDLLRHFYPVLLYTVFFCETGAINRMFFSDFLDPILIRWDEAIFGFQPSVVFMDKLPYLAVSEIFYLSYFSYYIMIVGVGLTLFIRNRQQFLHYVSIVSFLFYVCYFIYIILPVIGSRAFFHQVEGYALPPESQLYASTDAYPESVKAGIFFRLMLFIYRVFEAPGAAFPSSHVAVALCTLYFSFKYLRPIRYVHLFFAVLLCLSTIYCRYHYAVDVAAGSITAALVVPLGNWLYRRFKART